MKSNESKIRGVSSSVRIHGDSFNNFQNMTKDAWDDGDDDVMKMMVNKKKCTKPSSVKSNSITVFINNTPSLDSASNKLPSATNKTNSFNTSKASIFNPNSVRQSPRHQPSSSISNYEVLRVEKFRQILQSPNLDIDELQKLSWSGIPSKYRPVTWKLLSGYLPPSLDRQESLLKRKRQEYHNYLDQYYITRHQSSNQDTHRQIEIDVPRMSPHVPLFQQAQVQEIFKRILYIWAIRHPASGYVQGMNDLVTPFFVVFLSEYLHPSVDVESADISQLKADELQQLEADCFWSYSKVLEGIQDNYTFAQPGIQTRICRLRDLVSRIDNTLHRHLESHKVEYLQFTFRWMNNLLMRELPLRCILRLWDTYLSEAYGFASFHLYVCAAFLTGFSNQLQAENDFQGLMLLLQNFPTHHWGDEDISLILAEAYRLKYSFADAPKHLSSNSNDISAVKRNK